MAELAVEALDLTPLRTLLAAHAGEGRSALLPVLLAAQAHYGYLSSPVTANTLFMPGCSFTRRIRLEKSTEP